MKTKILKSSVIVICFLLSSCTQISSTIFNEDSKSRIKVKEQAIVNGAYYYIIEVDSIEYLTQFNGGFIRLEK